MPPNKKAKVTRDDHSVSDHTSDEAESFSDAGTGTSPDTDDEITHTRGLKPKTLKRKRRATGPSQFGVTLQSLLGTDAPSALPLSLKPAVARQHNDVKLELKAMRMLQVERKEKEDRGRIRDVIEGWGAESERSLRKVAQRGVVKLFNTIQQSQMATAAADAEAKAARGSGKPSLPGPSLDKYSKGKRKGKHKDNIIGRAKESGMDKDNFFEVIRSGGIVSKV